MMASTISTVTKSGRHITKPKWLEDFDLLAGEPKANEIKTKPRLWQVQDIMDRRETEEGGEVLVKWAGWEGPCDWVKLKDNPELRSYLYRNLANPDCCTAVKVRLEARTPQAVKELDNDILVIRSCVFDLLGGARFTPEGNTGFQKRVSVNVPFGADAWRRHFCPLFGHQEVQTTDEVCTVTALSGVLGEGWDRRCYLTSTETYVSKTEGVRVKWGYKERTNFNHDTCVRCTWQGPGPELLRPQICSGYTEEFVPGPAELTLIFTRKRRNRVLLSIHARERDWQTSATETTVKTTSNAAATATTTAST